MSVGLCVSVRIIALVHGRVCARMCAYFKHQAHLLSEEHSTYEHVMIHMHLLPLMQMTNYTTCVRLAM